MTVHKFQPKPIVPKAPEVDIYQRLREQRASIDWARVARRGVHENPVDIPYRAKWKEWRI